MPDTAGLGMSRSAEDPNVGGGARKVPSRAPDACAAAVVEQEAVEEVIEDDYAGEIPRLRSNKSILKQQGSGGSYCSDENGGDNGRLKRSVSWHDFQGKELHTVREYVPSEHDDDELIYQPEKKGSCCTIC